MGDGAKVVCRNLVGGARQGHGLDHWHEPYRGKLEVKQVLKCTESCRIVVAPQGTPKG